jgi:hypothetical protein
MNAVRFSLVPLALCLSVLVPVAVTAQSMAAGPAHMAHPIKVNKCSPQRNVSTAMSPGYSRAFYPSGYGYGYGNRYWGWPSVYGPTYYQYPVEREPTLGIDYFNRTSIVMKEIEFGLVVRGNLVAEVRDVGTFSPGAEIKHEFGLSPNVFPIQTSFAECVPLKIVFADGSKWKNPHLPALRRSIYGPVH